MFMSFPHSEHINRVDVNRPILGIRIPGYFVFSAHADPIKRSNEINASISKVSAFMANKCPNYKWILMGDFNAAPNQIIVPPPFRDCSIAIVAPTVATKPTTNRIIDYGVYGGPNDQGRSLQATTHQDLLGSDHRPVKIESV